MSALFSASHVRRVRVPSQASDVDQFLDDLFMPVLDGNLDELSDARSLAASIKGGGEMSKSVGHQQRTRRLSSSSSLLDDEVATLTGSSAASTLRYFEKKCWSRILCCLYSVVQTKEMSLALLCSAGGQMVEISQQRMLMIT